MPRKGMIAAGKGVPASSLWSPASDLQPLMMPAVVAARAMACRRWGVSWLGGGSRGGIAQIGCQHQRQRRNDAEGEKCIQRRQDAAQVARRAAGEPPGNRAGRKAAEGGNRARTGSDFEVSPALRTHDVVRVRRRFRRGNFRLAMRTYANRHGSPPSANAYNNRKRAPMKRR
jgi:hypothetical protein